MRQTVLQQLAAMFSSRRRDEQIPNNTHRLAVSATQPSATATPIANIRNPRLSCPLETPLERVGRIMLSDVHSSSHRPWEKVPFVENIDWTPHMREKGLNNVTSSASGEGCSHHLVEHQVDARFLVQAMNAQSAETRLCSVNCRCQVWPSLLSSYLRQDTIEYTPWHPRVFSGNYSSP